MMAAFNGEMFVVKPRWSGDCFSVNIVRKLVLAMCSSSLHIIGNTTIPLLFFELFLSPLFLYIGDKSPTLANSGIESCAIMLLINLVGDVEIALLHILYFQLINHR
jgi:hypothetical protein